MKTSPWEPATRVARSGLLGIATSMILVAAAFALEVVPDPVA
jgi:hypothetical protein